MRADPVGGAIRVPAIITLVAELATILLGVLTVAFPRLGLPTDPTRVFYIPAQLPLAVAMGLIALLCGIVVTGVGIIEGIRSRQWRWTAFFLAFGILSLLGTVLLVLQILGAVRMPLTPEQGWATLIVSALALLVLAIGGITYRQPRLSPQVSGASAG